MRSRQPIHRQHLGARKKMIGAYSFFFGFRDVSSK
jgi:hypothetical protein